MLRGDEGARELDASSDSSSESRTSITRCLLADGRASALMFAPSDVETEDRGKTDVSSWAAVEVATEGSGATEEVEDSCSAMLGDFLLRLEAASSLRSTKSSRSDIVALFSTARARFAPTPKVCACLLVFSSPDISSMLEFSRVHCLSSSKFEGFRAREAEYARSSAPVLGGLLGLGDSLRTLECAWVRRFGRLEAAADVSVVEVCAWEEAEVRGWRFDFG